MTKTVLLVEPSFYGVDFVKSAKQLGCQVVCIVSDPVNPPKYGYAGFADDLIVTNIKSSEAIYQAIRQSKYADFDALIPATDYVTEVTAEVGQRFHAFGNSVFATMCARNKDMARIQYAKEKVPSAQFAVVKTFDEAVVAAKELQFPLILKPTNTASSIDVFYIDNLTTLQKRFTEISSLKTSYLGFHVRPEFIMESFLQGPEYSVELFLNQDKIAFAEVTEKHTTRPPYFVELMHVFPAPIEDKQKQAIINKAEQAVKAIGFHNGPTHVEVKLTPTGARVVEVNGRPGGDQITADLIQDAYGINIFQKTIELYLNHTVAIQPVRHQAALIKFLYAQKDGQLVKITGLDWVHELPEFQRLKINTQIGSQVVVPENSDDRLGYIILAGENGKELKRVAESIDQRVAVIVK